jgi:hypothetical protein
MEIKTTVQSNYTEISYIEQIIYPYQLP